MADIGIAWIDVVFDWTGRALVALARGLAISYEEVNVWLFRVFWPLATLAMAAAIAVLWRRVCCLRALLDVVAGTAA